MPLVWVTGNSGVGKSTVCAILASRGHTAVEADWEGYSHWVDRETAQVVVDPPYPVPPGWLYRFAWRISRAKVEALSMDATNTTVFLCGSAENEAEVADLLDLVVCLVTDSDTILGRLQNRTSNTFGQHPEERGTVLERNDSLETIYRQLGATVIDAGRTPTEIADAVLAAAGMIGP